MGHNRLDKGNTMCYYIIMETTKNTLNIQFHSSADKRVFKKEYNVFSAAIASESAASLVVDVKHYPASVNLTSENCPFIYSIEAL